MPIAPLDIPIKSDGDLLQAAEFDALLAKINDEIIPAINSGGGGGGGGGTITLSAPSGSSVTAGNASVVHTWTRRTHNNGYVARRATTSDMMTGLVTAAIAIDTETKTWTGLVNGTVYYFDVQATGDGTTYLDSPFSTPVSTTPALPTVISGASGYWRFDQGVSSTSRTDLSGSGNTLSLGGTKTDSTTGSTFVSSDTATFTLVSNTNIGYTTQALVKLTSFGHELFGNNTAPVKYSIYIASATDITVSSYGGPGILDHTPFTGASGITLSEFLLITAVVDAVSGTIDLYVHNSSGELSHQTQSGLTVYGPEFNNIMGEDASFSFIGKYAAAIIYDRPLDATEVLQNKTAFMPFP